MESYEVIRVKNFGVKDFFNDAQAFRKTKEFQQQQVTKTENEDYVKALQAIQEKQKQLDSKN